jgi:hypothetical protein
VLDSVMTGSPAYIPVGRLKGSGYKQDSTTAFLLHMGRWIMAVGSSEVPGSEHGAGRGAWAGFMDRRLLPCPCAMLPCLPRSEALWGPAGVR